MWIDKKCTLYTHFVNFSTCNFLFREQNILLRIASKSHVRELYRLKGRLNGQEEMVDSEKWKVKR